MKDFKGLPLITIGIPVYNVEDYIGDALRSALDQTYPNLEIWIVDDKTPDKSIEMAKQIIASHPRRDSVHFICHEQNKGLSCARNTIIDAATGEYLFFMDSDDYLSTDCIEKLYSYMAKYDADYVEGSFDIVTEDKLEVTHIHQHIAKYIKDPECILNQKHPNYLFNYPPYPFISVWNKIYRTQFIKDSSLYFKPGILYEDHYFSFSTNLKATSCYLLPDITYHYRLRKASITHVGNDQYTLREIDDFCKLLEWKKQIAQQNKDKTYYDIIVREVVYYSFYNAMTFFRKKENIETNDISPYLKRFLTVPFNLKDILKYSQHKRENILFLIFFSLPLCIQCLYFRHKK